MKIHGLKTTQPYFGQVKNGAKTAELRKNDHDFKAGDLLLLQEYKITGASVYGGGLKCISTSTYGHYTGQFILVEITDVCNYPDALKDGYVMLSFKKLEGQA